MSDENPGIMPSIWQAHLNSIANPPRNPLMTAGAVLVSDSDWQVLIDRGLIRKISETYGEVDLPGKKEPIPVFRDVFIPDGKGAYIIDETKVPNPLDFDFKE